MATTIRVPKTKRGVYGFIKNINDEAFAAEKPITFEGDHTVAMRILCEITDPWRPTRGVITITARQTMSGVDLYMGDSKMPRGREFRKRLRDELESASR